MTELSIVVPLSALPKDIPLTTEGLLRTLADAQSARESEARYRDLYNSLIATFKSAGNSLQLILDEVDGEFERVQALRRFAQELKEAGNELRETL